MKWTVKKHTQSTFLEPQLTKDGNLKTVSLQSWRKAKTVMS